MSVSIIIPTYKSWELLSKCLEAIKCQDFDGIFEVIVVDNELDSQIPEFLNLEKNVTILNETLPGSYAARNRGISNSKYDILVFTDADCIPHKDWLKKGVDTLIRTKCGIVAGDVQLFYKNSRKLSIAEVYDKYTAFNQKGYVKNRNCVTANWFSYKSTMKEFGYFNQGLKSSGDSELSRKISDKYPILYEKDAIVYHPARYTMGEIITKYNRLIGGAYDRFFRDTDKNFDQYIRTFIFKRIKFNLNLFFKLKLKDGFKIMLAHFRLLPSIVAESKKIQRGSETQRL